MFDFIERLPLRYWPPSNTDYAWHRLPHPSNYAGMHLSDTHAVYYKPSDRETSVISFLVRVLVTTILLLFIGPLIPRQYAMPIAFSLAWIRPVFSLLTGTPMTIRSLLWKASALPAGVLVFSYAGPAFGHRLHTGTALAILSVITLRVAARDIHSFWLARLKADNRLTRQQRDEITLSSVQLDWPYIGSALCIAVVVPAFSPFIALVAFYGLTVGFLAYRKMTLKVRRENMPWNRLISFAISATLYPRNYIINFVPYPGCWNPSKHARLVWSSSLALLAVAATLAISLSAFLPWDAPFAKSQFQRVFRTQILPDRDSLALARKLAPAVNWNRFPKPYAPSEGALIREDVYAQLPSLPINEQRELLTKYKRQLQERAVYEAGIDKQTAIALNSSPYLWIYVAFRGLFTTSSGFAYCFPVVFASAALVAPFFLFVSAFRWFPVLQQTRVDIQRGINRDDKRPRTEWERYTRILANSDHVAQDPLTKKSIREADHFFMGHEPQVEFPILLHKSILSQHVYILGGTGFGKTSLGIMPLVMRLIRGETTESQKDAPQPERSETKSIPAQTNHSPMPPMLIIDLKGDMALFQTVKEEVQKKANAEGRTLHDAFRVFTCEHDHASHRFNPFANLGARARSTVEICSIFLDALNLNHGEGYGKSYYTKQSRTLLNDVLKASNPKSFRELYSVLKEKKGSKEYRDAYELVATIEALNDYENIARESENPSNPAIIMQDVVRNRQVVYFWLPAAEHSTTAREIAGLALYTFYTAQREWVRSNEWRERQKSSPNAYLIIDEFQRVASFNYPNILREARAFGLGIIMAHQSSSDLKLSDLDLAPIVNENTRLKLFFAIQDAHERENFSKLSGQEIAVQRSFSTSSTNTLKYAVRPGNKKPSVFWETETTDTVSMSPIMKQRITTNDIIATSDSPFEYYMLVGQGAGYTQFGGYPIPVRTSWAMPEKEYERRSVAEWPSLNELGIRPEPRVVEKQPTQKKENKKPHKNEAEADAFIQERLAALKKQDPSVFT